MRPPLAFRLALGWIAFACSVVLVPSHLLAQTSSGNPWREGTMLSGFVGAGRAVGTNAVAGGAIDWELVPHLTVEGRGAWFRVGNGAGAFTGLLGIRVPLRPAQPVVPFLSAGVGLHRVTFDSTTTATVPNFYRRRMTAGPDPAAYTFDDFTMALAGGVDVRLAEHLTLRPELTVLAVRAPSDTHVVPVFAVHIAYHFENRFVTP